MEIVEITDSQIFFEIKQINYLLFVSLKTNILFFNVQFYKLF